MNRQTIKEINEKLKIGRLVKIHWKDAVEYFVPSPIIHNKLDINIDVGWVIDQDKEAVTLVRGKTEDGFIPKASIMIIGKNTIQKVRLL